MPVVPLSGMTVAFDLDEVLSDTYALMVSVAEHHGAVLRDHREYHPHAMFDLPDVRMRLLREDIDARLAEARPLFPLTLVKHLAGTFRLCVVTGRSASRHAAQTESFLDRCYPGCFDSVSYADLEGENLPKRYAVRSLGAVAHVEDHPAYVLDVASGDIPVCYFHRSLPWQEEISHPLVETCATASEVSAWLLGRFG